MTEVIFIWVDFALSLVLYFYVCLADPWKFTSQNLFERGDETVGNPRRAQIGKF